MFSAFVIISIILTFGVPRLASLNICSITEHRFMIQFLEVPSLRVFCEGILLSDLWVLTVAHCFYDPTDKTPDNLIAQGGLSLFKNIKGTQRIQGRMISKIVVHKGFRIFESGMMHNDIAMVKLARRLYQSRTVNYAELPRRTGGGSMLTSAAISQKYIYVTIVDNEHEEAHDETTECINPHTVISKEECEKLPVWIEKDKPVFSKMICTKKLDWKPCGRSFGGPLVHNYTTIVGMASLHASACSYLLFTKIEPHLDFIEHQLQSPGPSHHFDILLLLLIQCTCLFISF